MKFSPQQEAVFSAVEDPQGGNIAVEAVAGSGKTTTLVEACARMKGSVAFCAYNKKIADEIKVRVAKMANVRAGTFHSFGFSAWRRVAPNVRVDGKKLFTLQEQLRQPEWVAEFARMMVSLAKQAGFGVLVPMDDTNAWYRLMEHFEADDKLPDNAASIDIEQGIQFARQLLEASNAACREVIDFDDMLYAPLLFNAKIWQNDWVLVDEAQDTNAVRRALAKKMLRAGGRLVAVGDSRQAIYGFTGADNDAFDLIVRDFNCRRLPLTVTYRCPKAVVAHARQWVEHITAADSAPEGTLTGMSWEQFSKLDGSALAAGDAILCRNTKPLVELAYQLIRRGIGARVEGRDIGAGLLALAFRWKRVRSLGALVDQLDEYLERETQKLLAKGQELKAASVEDRVETLKAICASLQPGATLADLRQSIERLFGDTEPGAPVSTVILSTVHKSKGREWRRVYLLGREALMPSRYARQAWQITQEHNLIYVAVTRSKGTLVEVAMPPESSKKGR